MAILELEQVTYSYRTRYQQVDALKDVSYAFEPGKLYALVGKSGSGKSTLLSLMAGLDLPQQGRILYEGKSTKELNLTHYRREKAAVIYQSFRLFPLLTVAENITYPMELRKVSAKTARKRVGELLEKVNLPASMANRFPGMLSGGEQQRVAVARALSMETKLLLADEPTGNLDSENSLHIVSLLRDLAHQDGYCVIVVTHDMEIAALADEVLTMRDGRLQE
ncbi:MAG: ABC transporter ATP-binding protein [Oscillospiraceae bacterium]|nr:ABC transporter ATP-binding protein [Oscillospiraceae bacterium]